MNFNKKVISLRNINIKDEIETTTFVYADPRNPSNRFPVIVGVYPANLFRAEIRWPHDIEKRVAEVPFNYSFTDGSIFEPQIFKNAFIGMRETDMIDLSGGDIGSIVAVSDLNDYPSTDGAWLMEKREDGYHVLLLPSGASKRFEIGDVVKEYNVRPTDLSMFTGPSFMLGVTENGKLVIKRVSIEGTGYDNLNLTIDNPGPSITLGAKVRPIILSGKAIKIWDPSAYLGDKALLNDIPHQQLFCETCPRINRELKRILASNNPFHTLDLFRDPRMFVLGLSEADIKRLREKSGYIEKESAGEVMHEPGTFYLKENDVYINLKRQRFAWTIFVTGHRNSDGKKVYMLLKNFYNAKKTVGLLLEEAADFVFDIAKSKGITVEDAVIGAAGGDVRLLEPQGGELVIRQPETGGIEVKPGFSGLSNALVFRRR